MLNDIPFAQFIVLYGLPLILVILLGLILISYGLVRYVCKIDKYFDYVTVKLFEIFECEHCNIIEYQSEEGKNDHTQNLVSKTVGIAYVNIDCDCLKLEPTSKYIQFPYFVRYLSYILFWTYFVVQFLFLDEVIVSEPVNGYKCFNLTKSGANKLYRCENYGLKSLDDILRNCSEMAGVFALHASNKIIFYYSYKFFRWMLATFFKKYHSKLALFSSNLEANVASQHLISLSQLSYLLLLAYLTYVIYDNLVTENYYVSIKFVCYSVLIFSTILSAYETARYAIAYEKLGVDQNQRALIRLKID